MEFIWHSRCKHHSGRSPGEPRSTMSRQLGLAPRRTGSTWASPEVTHSVWFWWIWWTILPFRSQSQTGHLVQLILSTLLYWAAFPYWVLSIWSVGVRDWAHDVSTRQGWDHSVDWSIPDIPQSGQECDLTEFPWAGSGHRSSPGGSLWCIWSVWSPGRRYEPNQLIKHVMCKFPVSWQRVKADWRMFIMKGFKTRATSPASGSTY